MFDNKNNNSNQAVKKLFIFVGFFLFTIVFFLLGSDAGWFDIFKSQEKLLILVTEFGLVGPVVIILLIASAIVISPVPSAPIALVSGLLYGHVFGTIYVVIGALSGAMIAFMIARKLGYDYINRKLHLHMPVKLFLGSQNTLMMIVFLSRLAPFISFDVISYAAGLTKLTLTRFFLASLLGIIPISFILAHMGSELSNGKIEAVSIALLILSFFTIVPLTINKIFNRKN